MRKNHDIIEISRVLLHQTERAYLFDTGEIDENRKAIGIWVPKSLCEYDEETCALEIPENIAVEKGLV